jgi:hypothetical protein
MLRGGRHGVNIIFVLHAHNPFEAAKISAGDRYFFGGRY